MTQPSDAITSHRRFGSQENPGRQPYSYRPQRSLLFVDLVSCCGIGVIVATSLQRLLHHPWTTLLRPLG